MHVTARARILRSGPNASPSTARVRDHAQRRLCAHHAGDKAKIVGRPNNIGDCAHPTVQNPGGSNQHLQRADRDIRPVVVVQHLLGTGQLQQERAPAKRSSARPDMAGRDFPVYVAPRHSHLTGRIVDDVRIAVRLVDISRHRAALGVDVSVVDIAEKCFPRRTNIATAEGHAGRTDRVRLCVRVH